MQLLDETFREIRILPFQCVQVVPIQGIKVVHQIEYLPDVVIDRSPSHQDAMSGIQLIKALE